MGWASGSSLLIDVWNEVREFIPEEKRQVVARNVIDRFADMDCDTIGEAETIVIDAGLEDKYWGD